MDGLRLTGIRRSFGELVALDGVGLEVPRGRIAGFVGRNGAGKTTTMRIVCGLLEPDAGDVRWAGAPADAEMRRRIGYMPEERGLYPKMRVGDQLEYLGALHGLTRAEARAAARAWLDRLGIADREDARAEELSQGNQQRVQLATTLVHRPALLILDEPFAGLDPIVTDVLADVLREEAARGAAVLFSSHQLDVVERLCDVVVVIDRGRVVADGAVPDLRAGGPRHVRVRVAGADPTWVDALGDVRVVEREGDAVSLVLDDHADPQAILDAARAAGRVTEYVEQHPSLTELFRELVG